MPLTRPPFGVAVDQDVQRLDRKRLGDGPHGRGPRFRDATAVVRFVLNGDVLQLTSLSFQEEFAKLLHLADLPPDEFHVIENNHQLTSSRYCGDGRSGIHPPQLFSQSKGRILENVGLTLR
jgi:hypothetical protein